MRNPQARRLNEACGYSMTDEVQHYSGEEIVRYQLQLAGHT